MAGDKRARDAQASGAPKKQKYNPFLKKKEKVVLLSREDRKAKAKERKAAKPNYDVVSQLNSLWTQSLAALPAKERSSRIDELLEAAKGKVLATARRHDASRAFQSLLKHGSHAQRAAVMEELRGNMVDLATNKYGHHVVLKLLQFGNQKTRDSILDEFTRKGKRSVERLAFHLDGAKVLDFAYASSGGPRRDAVLKHFYGPEFALFDDGEAGGDEDGDEAAKDAKPATGAFLARLLEEHPEKRQAVLDNLLKAVEKAVNKEMLMFRFIHTLIVQYLELAEPAKARDVAQQVSSHVVDLYHSEDGARVVMHCIEQGSPKERKAVLKALKEVASPAALDPYGFMVVIRALDVVDDTVLLRKQVLQPLMEDLDELADDLNGSRVLLHLLAPRDPRYMHPSLAARLQPPTRVVRAEDGTESVEPTNRKDAEQRRAELLDVLRGPILDCVARNATKFIRSKVGCRVAVEAVREATADGKAFDGEPRVAMKALARTASKTQEAEEAEERERAGHQHVSFGGDDGEEEEGDEDGGPAKKKKKAAAAAPKKAAGKARPWLPVLEDPRAHYTMKHLLEAVEGQDEAAEYFTSQLVAAIESMGEDRLESLALTNRSAFVLATLLKVMPADARTEFAAALKPVVPQLRESTWAGCKVLADAVEPQAAAGNKSDQKKKTKTTKKAAAATPKKGSKRAAAAAAPATPAGKKAKTAATPVRRSARKRK